MCATLGFYIENTFMALRPPQIMSASPVQAKEQMSGPYSSYLSDLLPQKHLQPENRVRFVVSGVMGHFTPNMTHQ